jgi:putative transposase
MYRAYKYQIFPTAEQKTVLDKNMGCARWVYNYGLNLKIETYQRDGKSISRFDIQSKLPILKKSEETIWLADAYAQSLQASLERLDKAFTRFFKEKKGFPRFKSKKDTKQSYSIPTGVSVNWDNGTIKIPKAKDVDICLSLRFTGTIKTSTVSSTPTGKYYISILVDAGLELPTKPVPNINEAIGIDLGIKDFATLSDGTKVANPKHYRKKMKKLAMLQRRHSRKVKGSSNRNKQRIKVAKHHERVANLRKDFLHKLSTKLVRENQTICMEDLSVRNMVKNRKLSLSISDAGWGMFKKMVAYKCDRYGKNLITIGRFEPSSKMCSCGVVNKELKLKDRVWTCSSCNTTHDRDVLAAQNIVRFAFHPKNKIAEGTPQINAFGDGAIVPSTN